MWVEFKEQCRLRNIDHERLLDEWIIDEDMREAAEKMSAGHERPRQRRDGERSWGENDQVALALLKAGRV